MQVRRRRAWSTPRGVARPEEIVVVKRRTVVVLAVDPFGRLGGVAGAEVDAGVFGSGGTADRARRSALPS